jgi:hypothetical protein
MTMHRPARRPFELMPRDALLVQEVREEQAESSGRALPHPKAPSIPTAAEHLALISDALHVPRDTPWDELVQLVMVRCRPMDRQHMDRLVAGCLKSAIHAHGPITHERLYSAAKRMSGQIHAVLGAQHQGLDDPGQGVQRRRQFQVRKETES